MTVHSAKKITKISVLGCVLSQNGHEKCQNLYKLSPKKRNILTFSLAQELLTKSFNMIN
jgi:hypothetical protein